MGNILLDEKAGIIDPDEVIKKGLDNCVVKEFADIGVKFINIHNIRELIKDVNENRLMQYGVNLKNPDVPGEGLIFYSENYTLWTTMLALFLTLGVVIAIGVNSFRQIKQHMNSYETESIL